MEEERATELMKATKALRDDIYTALQKNLVIEKDFNAEEVFTSLTITLMELVNSLCQRSLNQEGEQMPFDYMLNILQSVYDEAIEAKR